MNTSTHYETNFIRISFLKDKGFIEEVWKDFAEDDEIKIAKNKLTEMLKHTGASAYLSDLRGFKGASPENQLWVRDVWFPEAYKAGLRTIAFLFLEDVFAQFSVKTAIGGEYAQKVNLQKFKTIEEAEKWLSNF